MPSSTISYTLNLVILLIDATSGRLVNSPRVQLYQLKENGFEETYPMKKDSATYVFINGEKNNCRYKVEATGYLTQEFDVNFNEMQEGDPIREVYLVPELDSFNRDAFITMEGKLKGLSYMSGINTKDIVSHAERYDSKRVMLHTFESASLLGAGGSPYGVLNQESVSFEEFCSDGTKGTNAVRLRHSLTREVVRNSPVARVILGQVSSDGSYVFRVKKDMNKQLNFLIKYIVDGEVKYKEIDFTNSEVITWNLQ